MAWLIGFCRPTNPRQVWTVLVGTGLFIWGLGLSTRAAPFKENGQALFESTNLFTFSVELGEAERRQLAERPKSYVLGRVCVGDQIFENVGVRLKGFGTFQPISRRPSLALKFNWRIPGQEFAGLSKVLLNNSFQDQTLLCEFAASSAFTAAKVPVPRISHARLRLNGRDLGLYVVAEAVNKHFLKRHFPDGRGILYEGEFSDINTRLDQDNGEPSDRSDLRQLTAAAREIDPNRRRELLEKILNVEEFLNFLAVESIVANWDGYAINRNNYRIYHDPTSGLMSFIPHGLDNSFFEGALGLVPPRRSVLASALLRTAEDREAFKQRVAALLPRVLDLPALRVRLQAEVARMRQAVTPAEAEGIAKRAALFEKRLGERVHHLQAELAGTKPKAPQFSEDGVARLEGWAPKPDWNHALLNSVPGDKQVPQLTIQATNGFCFGSWRLSVWLEPGKYQLDGLAKTAEVNGLPSRTGSGAGVRVVGSSRGSGVQGTSDWTSVSHDFVVQEGCQWIELIAELRAFRGRATFDSGAFRLVRIPPEP